MTRLCDPVRGYRGARCFQPMESAAPVIHWSAVDRSINLHHVQCGVFRSVDLLRTRSWRSTRARFVVVRRHAKYHSNAWSNTHSPVHADAGFPFHPSANADSIATNGEQFVSQREWFDSRKWFFRSRTCTQFRQACGNSCASSRANTRRPHLVRVRHSEQNHALLFSQSPYRP